MPKGFRPFNHPLTMGLDEICTMLDRNRYWVLRQVGHYGDPQLLRRAKRWQRSLPRPKRPLRRSPVGHVLLRYLKEVGLPMPTVSRLLWDSVSEQWNRDLRRTYRRPTRPHYQLPPWEAMCGPSSSEQPQTAPPSCLNTLTD